VVIPKDWYALVGANAKEALAEQVRIRSEFQSAFASGMVCRGFVRDETKPRYLLYND